MRISPIHVLVLADDPIEAVVALITSYITVTRQSGAVIEVRIGVAPGEESKSDELGDREVRPRDHTPKSPFLQEHAWLFTELCRASGKKVREIADAMGMSTAAVCAYRQGYYSMNKAALSKLPAALGLSEDHPALLAFHELIESRGR